MPGNYSNTSYSSTTNILFNLSNVSMSSLNLQNPAQAAGIENRNGRFYLDGPGFYPEDRAEDWVRPIYDTVYRAITAARTSYAAMPDVPWIEVLDMEDGKLIATVKGTSRHNPYVYKGRQGRHE